MFDEILIFGALGILSGLLAGMFGIKNTFKFTDFNKGIYTLTCI